MGRFTRLFKIGRMARLGTWLIALWKLVKHPQTPRPAKWLAFAVIAYAVSPIDLIPDFIPILGQLDDLIIVPLGVALVVKMTPKPLWEALLREAEVSSAKLPKMWWGAAAIVAVWMLALGGVGWWLVRSLSV